MKTSCRLFTRSLNRSAAPLVGVTILVAATFPGCRTSPPAPSPPPPSVPARDTIHTESYPNVTIDPQLEGFILQARSTVTREHSSGLMTVRVPVRSGYGGELFLQYRVLFLDDFGSVQNPKTPWRQFTLAGRQRTVLEATSLRDNATQWQMEIRPARPE